LAVEENDKKIIGIITALTDNVNFGFIPYLEILPEYQNKGIGTKLFKKMLKKLTKINCIDLTCDANVQTFYKKFNMYNSTGMIIRK
jgi:ribosomal protein S18 acetylase RimI-like enzyme